MALRNQNTMQSPAPCFNKPAESGKVASDRCVQIRPLLVKRDTAGVLSTVLSKYFCFLLILKGSEGCPSASELFEV